LPSLPPGQQPDFDNSPEKQVLLGYKGMIYGMWIQLAPPADLRQINRGVLDTIIADLNAIFVGVQNMKNSVDLDEAFFITDAFCEKISLYALVELYAASERLDEGDIHEYFRCLMRCPKYLEEALAQFRI
jgi:hypothetical protein